MPLCREAMIATKIFVSHANKQAYGRPMPSRLGMGGMMGSFPMGIDMGMGMGLGMERQRSKGGRAEPEYKNRNYNRCKTCF